MKRIYLCLVITIAAAFGCTAAYAQDAQDIVPAQMVTTPTLSVPKEASESGLGGIVRVLIAIDASGNVTSVEDVTGPGPVCRQVKREDVTAMREAAREAAMRARFNPATRKANAVDSSMWLNFTFPSRLEEKAESGAATTALPADGNKTTVKGDINFSTANAPRADGNKYTIKGDGNFPVANTPPPDYRGPVNVGGSYPDEKAGGNIPRQIVGGVLNGKATSLPKPAYPAAARAVGASGAVTIQVLIDENGDIFSARAISGHPLLRAASALAACSSKFSPTQLSGFPVKVSGLITYNFVP